MTSPADSYRLCERLSRRSASSFYWSFWLLPKLKRRSMCALYAFSRKSDDLADDELHNVGERRQALAKWRGNFESALAGDDMRDPLLPAICDTVNRFRVPQSLLLDVIAGVEMDLENPRFEDFEQLSGYCRLVASAVGIACLHIWGFNDDSELVRQGADACGIAFQLTNILRDLKEDAERGRCYLPRNEIEKFGCDEAMIREAKMSDEFRQLMRFQVERAKGLFQQALTIRPYIHRDGKRMFDMMVATYRTLLAEIERNDGDVFSRRIRLSLPKKLAIALRSFTP